MATSPGNDRSTAGEREVWAVLHMTPSKRGSLEQQLLGLAARLRGSNVRMTCVFAGAPADWMAAELTALGVAWQVLDFSHGLASALKLGRLLMRAKPALVHFHFVRASSPLVAAARFAGARVVVNDHVTLTRATDSATYEALKHARDAALNPLVDRRVAVSRVVAESVHEVEHVDRAHIDTIENGIDLPRFARASGVGVRAELLAQGRRLMICVSRLNTEKGVETAVRALPLIVSAGHDPLLLVAGEGPELANLRALAVELGVTRNIRFLGQRDDVERLLAACEIAVVPSHWEEAFGLAVVEGMAAGKAVVVSESGAMPELVGDAGVVVPKRDPGALAGAITRLLDDPLLAIRLGRAARVRAHARFGLSRWVDQVVALYGVLCPQLVEGRRAA